MKKIVCVVMAIALMVALSSCGIGFPIKTDDKLAESRIDQLGNAIKQQDKEAVKKLFSENALEEAEDIDSEIDELLSYVQGEVISYSRDGQAMQTSDTIEYGYKTKELHIWFTLDTDEESYLVFLDDYPVDTINPENVGLYTIRILRAEDEEKLEEYLRWGDSDLYSPGVDIVENHLKEDEI